MTSSKRTSFWRLHLPACVSVKRSLILPLEREQASRNNKEMAVAIRLWKQQPFLYLVQLCVYLVFFILICFGIHTYPDASDCFSTFPRLVIPGSTRIPAISGSLLLLIISSKLSSVNSSTLYFNILASTCLSASSSFTLSSYLAVSFVISITFDN